MPLAEVVTGYTAYVVVRCFAESAIAVADRVAMGRADANGDASQANFRSRGAPLYRAAN